MDKREQFAVKAEALSDDIVVGKCCRKSLIANEFEDCKGRHKDAHKPAHVFRNATPPAIAIKKIASENYACYDKTVFYIFNGIGFSVCHWVVYKMTYLVFTLSIHLLIRCSNGYDLLWLLERITG